MEKVGISQDIKDPQDYFNPDKTPFDANLHALELYNEQKWDECMDFITKTCHKYPPSMTIPLRSIKGNIYRVSGKLSQALVEFEEIAYLDPHNITNQKSTACTLFLLGQHKQCLGLCDEVHALLGNKVDLDLLRLRAQCSERMGEFAEACNAQKQLTLIKPSVDLYVSWVSLCQVMGDISSATNILTKALSQYPQNHQLLVMFAKLHVRTGNVKNAFEHLRHALISSPLSTEANILLGSLLQNDSDFNGAQQKYRIGSRGPDLPEPGKETEEKQYSKIHHKNAILREKHAELQTTGHNMHAMVRAEATCSAEVWSNIALCFLNTGKYTAALATIQHALLLDPFTWTLHHNYGIIALTVGMHSIAFNAFTAAITLSNGCAPSQPLLAISLARMNELPTAQNVYQRVFEQQPNEPLHYLNACLGLLRMRNLSQNLSVYFKKFQEQYKPDSQNHAVEKAKSAVIQFIQKNTQTARNTPSPQNHVNPHISNHTKDYMSRAISPTERTYASDEQNRMEKPAISTTDNAVKIKPMPRRPPPVSPVISTSTTSTPATGTTPNGTTETTNVNASLPVRPARPSPNNTHTNDNAQPNKEVL